MCFQNRLAGCVFGETTSTLLADAQTVDPNTYYYNLLTGGDRYFSSRASCQNQNMRLSTFTVGKSIILYNKLVCTNQAVVLGQPLILRSVIHRNFPLIQ